MDKKVEMIFLPCGCHLLCLLLLFLLLSLLLSAVVKGLKRQKTSQLPTMRKVYFRFMHTFHFTFCTASLCMCVCVYVFLFVWVCALWCGPSASRVVISAQLQLFSPSQHFWFWETGRCRRSKGGKGEEWEGSVRFFIFCSFPYCISNNHTELAPLTSAHWDGRSWIWIRVGFGFGLGAEVAV